MTMAIGLTFSKINRGKMSKGQVAMVTIIR